MTAVRSVQPNQKWWIPTFNLSCSPIKECIKKSGKRGPIKYFLIRFQDYKFQDYDRTLKRKKLKKRIATNHKEKTSFQVS